MKNYKFRYKQKLIAFYNYLIENKIQKSVFSFNIEFIRESHWSGEAGTIFYMTYIKSDLANIVHLNGADVNINNVKIINTTGTTHFLIIGEVSLSNEFYNEIIKKDSTLYQPGNLNNYNLW